MKIQWYPGHMAKTKKMIKTHLSLVDILIELLDARIPASSKNPDIDRLSQDKQRILILNKSDLADAKINRLWEEYYRERGFFILTLDARSKNVSKPLTDLARDIMKQKIEKKQKRGLTAAAIRAMIVGIPNVGKSTLINSLTGRAGAAVADRPGVTRGKQWIKIKNDFELLDTPGVLWPKFEDPRVGINLAITGAVSEEVLDKKTLCTELLDILKEIKPDSYLDRYKLTACKDEMQAVELLEMIGRARGFKMKGGILDLERTAIMVLDEFRAGKMGRISLEKP